ncbi:hypothetical protein [Metapseudomonas otitidis]|uniref:Uncharacterized protein n=1 Tax=Metapseudomonas otitidis TaxID=319939 RepID=A0A679GEQ3_9GAMM|nr:hypothetical protein [Pseudomonas otitidis]BCA28605.1 hypothetical protein PtoMrB4_25820 [Pseudomonas otitidis]
MTIAQFPGSRNACNTSFNRPTCGCGGWRGAMAQPELSPNGSDLDTARPSANGLRG